jgi:DNA repair photolyase
VQNGDFASRRTIFVPYQPKTVLNKGKRADHWFWTRYSAYPYTGCQHGCRFCYCRERKYCPCDDPADFDHVIRVKENAPILLRRALRRVPCDRIATGDYQPAERKFGLSRQMLEVCLELGFPVFVLSRSPLVLRDLDLLQAINERARAAVVFSAISAPGSPNHERARQMERLAPPAEKRFAAMERIARAGILTGTCFMPILPGICDDDPNLANVVRWTADHGGRFVLAGGLTLADQQREYYFGILRDQAPDLLPLYEQLYPPGSYAPVSGPWRKIPGRIRELCQTVGIADRMPRPIIPGEKRALNKRVVEALANRVYDMELAGERSQKVWAYRKAAWAIEDLEQDVGLVYQTMGPRGLRGIQGVGPALAGEVERLILALARPDGVKAP